MGAQGGLLLIIIAIILLIVYFVSESRKKGSKGKKIASNVNLNAKDLKKNLEAFRNAGKKSDSVTDNSDRSRYKKNSKADVAKRDLFEFMEFEKIQDDMIVSEKGSKFTMVLQCKGINYDLMSEVEQLSVEEGFITFLNTLRSPIQIYVQARAIDLKTSLDMYKERVTEFNKEYEEKAEEYNRLANDMSTPEYDLRVAQVEREKIFNISEYAHDITRYVERLSLNKHMLQRKFYIVISYYKSEITSSTKFNDDELYDICYRELYTRAQGVISALQNCSVSARVLDSNELAELIYITYNRDDQRLLDIRTALESGFYRLYSQTKDLQEKKNDIIKKQIREEALNRLENALRLAIDKGNIITEDQRIDDFENDVDKTAVLMAEELDIPQNIKEDVETIIVKSHKQNAAERKAAREKRDAEIIDRYENPQTISDENEKNDESTETIEENSATNQNENIEKIEEVKETNETIADNDYEGIITDDAGSENESIEEIKEEQENEKTNPEDDDSGNESIV